MESGVLPYSVFTYDNTQNGMFGDGLPRIMSDPQKATNSAWRLLFDNASLSGVPMYLIDRAKVEPKDGRWEVVPGKIWYRIGGGLNNEPVLEVIRIEGSSEALIATVRLSEASMDDETSIPMARPDDGQSGTQAKQTAHGMAMLASAINIAFRDAARNFDTGITIPNIKRLYAWNMQYHPDDSVKGDMRVKARGSSVLLVREIQAQNLIMVLNLAATNPVMQQIVRIPQLMRQLFRALQVTGTDAVMTDEEIDAHMQRMQEEQGPSEAEIRMQVEQMKAETQIQIAEMQLKTEVVKAAATQGVAIQKIAADLRSAELGILSKERMQAAEIAVKERYGEGL